jgi:hypothetical protein
MGDDDVSPAGPIAANDADRRVALIELHETTAPSRAVVTA